MLIKQKNSMQLTDLKEASLSFPKEIGSSSFGVKLTRVTLLILKIVAGILCPFYGIYKIYQYTRKKPSIVSLSPQNDLKEVSSSPKLGKSLIKNRSQIFATLLICTGVVTGIAFHYFATIPKPIEEDAFFNHNFIGLLMLGGISTMLLTVLSHRIPLIASAWLFQILDPTFFSEAQQNRYFSEITNCNVAKRTSDTIVIE